MSVFDVFINQTRLTPQEYVNIQNLNLSNNVLVDSDVLISELQSIDKKSEAELYKLLSLSYRIVLDTEFINKPQHKIELAKAFQDAKFVSAFVNVVSQAESNLEPIQKICCNKLIYDYLTSSNRIEMITNMLYNLSISINQKSIAALCGRGLDQKLAAYMAAARYSSTDISLAAKRVNVIIINQPVSVMTEQMIVWIYEDLFSDSLMALFNGIMFDAWDFEDEDLALEEEQDEIYSTINLAILDIINEIPLTMCVQLLRSYAQAKQYNHSNEPTRFDIHSISSDYGRVLQAIEIVEAEGTLVPHR